MKLQRRVKQYDTHNNIDHQTDQTILASDIIDVTYDLQFPTKQNVGNGSMFKTFMDDFINYVQLPVRKKILMIPLAVGGTGFKKGEWKTAGKYAKTALSAMDDVLNPSKHANDIWNKLNCFFWYQGERVIDDQNESDFMNTWDLYKYSVYGFADEDFSKKFCEIGGNYGFELLNCENMQIKINNELLALSNNLSKGKYITTRDLKYTNASDDKTFRYGWTKNSRLSYL